jgi:hypothetical protein
MKKKTLITHVMFEFQLFFFFSILQCCSNFNIPKVYLAKFGNIKKYENIKSQTTFHIVGNFLQFFND